jgi:hypothetical protein
VEGNCTVGVLWLQEGAHQLFTFNFFLGTCIIPWNHSLFIKYCPFHQELINDYHRKVLLERLFILERLWFWFFLSLWLSKMISLYFVKIKKNDIIVWIQPPACVWKTSNSYCYWCRLIFTYDFFYKQFHLWKLKILLWSNK